MSRWNVSPFVVGRLSRGVAMGVAAAIPLFLDAVKGAAPAPEAGETQPHWPKAEEIRQCFEKHRISSLAQLPSPSRPWGVSWLPQWLKYSQGELSLIADPLEAGGKRTALYLVNSRPRTPGNDAWISLRGARIQVRTASGWKFLKPPMGGCGNGPYQSRLRGGEAFAMLADSVPAGETAGEIRYLMSGDFPAGPLVSESFKGLYAPDSLSDGSENFRYDQCLNSFMASAEDAEENLVAMELLRPVSPLPGMQGQIAKWGTGGGEVPVWHGDFVARRDALLSQEWAAEWNPDELVRHCLDLIRSHGAEADRPVPAELALRREIVAWRILNAVGNSSLRFLEASMADRPAAVSGNAWNADDAAFRELANLAKQGSAQPGHLGVVCQEILRLPWMPVADLSDQELIGRMSGKSDDQVRAGVELLNRGQKETVWSWMQRQAPLDDGTSTRIWAEFRSSHPAEPDEKELALLNRWIDGGFTYLWPVIMQCSYPVQDPDSPSRLPVGLGKALAQYLDSGREDALRPQPYQGEPVEGLCAALEYLASQDGADGTQVLRKYLLHPAADWINEANQPAVKIYPVREKAAELLRKKEQWVPPGILFRETLDSPLQVDGCQR